MVERSLGKASAQGEIETCTPVGLSEYAKRCSKSEARKNAKTENPVDPTQEREIE